MRAAYLVEPDADRPAEAIRVGELDPAPAPDGWVEVDVRAGALNMHDIWTLRGVGAATGRPHIIGSDAAGVAEGRDVIVYPVVPRPPDGKIVPHAILLPDAGHGVLAGRIAVPPGHLVAKPAHLSWSEAASLPTAWLTAYRMLFTKARVEPGHVVLVQGAGGGVATAAIGLAAAAGATVVVTSRSPEKRERALALGAAAAIGSGERVPQLADVVVETVGPATFEHSTRSTRAGGTIVVCGGTSGFAAELDLARLFAREISVHGSTMGTLAEFEALVAFVAAHRIRPAVDSTADLADVRAQAARMLAGAAFGKLCVSLS
ncbi:zinc-binding dehydrogenase [Dactylosporangium sp. AC04546]|uniref:zinc-binding dehydrogenase n=1 Tax=Dactylosporangium sp. AC04546 TaxID=2862460 RepID=UPI001EDF0E83|nr:zinc-binding dehydrogenase [Dactylosporangium sp. AC04546]WVK79280.1 zinc-binding dehydrogenase [Dactylosporangium sp. AC04546]